MDNGLTKKKHPYLTLLVAIIAMLIFPYCIFKLLSAVMKEYSTYSDALIFAQAESLTGLCSTVWALSWIQIGLYREPVRVVIERWHEFIGYIKCGLWGEGFRSYLQNIKENGINLVMFLCLTAFQVYLLVDGLQRFFNITGHWPTD